ncbi:MAG: integrase core domain-containing protein [Pirellulales bacterium]
MIDITVDPSWSAENTRVLIKSSGTASLAREVVRCHNRYDNASKYLLRDNDSIYGQAFLNRIASLGIEEVNTTYRSPWQNPFVERLIGSVRRECLDYVIVLNERHLKRVLCDYFG